MDSPARLYMKLDFSFKLVIGFSQNENAGKQDTSNLAQLASKFTIWSPDKRISGNIIALLIIELLSELAFSIWRDIIYFF